MAQLNQDFTKFVGDDFQIRFTVEDAGDIEAYDASWRAAFLSPLIKTKGSGITIDYNVVTVTINSADTSGVTPGAYTHELKLTEGGVGGIVARGTFTLMTPLH